MARPGCQNRWLECLARLESVWLGVAGLGMVVGGTFAMLRVSEDEFEALVERALDLLPPEFGELLDNVVVVIEQEPSEEDLALFEDMGDDDLLGLYRGVPLTERETGYFDLPDQVVIYRGPLTRYCRSRRELIREVRDTVVHELGHHFGLSDEEMPY